MANQHYYDFCNTPVHNRPLAWQQAELVRLKRALKEGDNGDGLFNSPDGYFDAKDRYWRFVAKMRNVAEHKANPMNYWYGRMSN